MFGEIVCYFWTDDMKLGCNLLRATYLLVTLKAMCWTVPRDEFRYVQMKT